MKRLLLAILAISGAVYAQLGVNLVKNPSFEELDANGYPAHWAARPETFKSSTDNKFDGERSIMYYNKTQGKYQFVTQQIPAKPGRTYEYTIYTKQVNVADTPKSGPSIFLEYYDNGKYIGGKYASTKISLNTDWVKLVGTTTIPMDAKSISVGFRATPSGTAAAEIWFDKCSVVEVEGAYIDDFSTTGTYRDTADGGFVTIFQPTGSAMKLMSPEAQKTTRMELVDHDGMTVLTLSPATIQDDFMTFTFDSGKLPTGTYTMRGSFTNKETGKTYTSKATFRKVDKLPQYKTYIDEHRRMIVDGKPFFPLGMYFLTVNKEILKPYIGTKFNCLMPYHPPTTEEMFDYLHENNLKLFYSIKGDVSVRKHDAKATEERQAKGIARLDKWKHHPAIAAWYINDELAADFVNDAIQYRRKCEEHDPLRPTWTVLCTPPDFRKFVPATEILGGDPYPIPEGKPDSAFRCTRDAKAAVMGSKMIIQVPQAFCWGNYWVGYGYSKEKCANCRRPTFQEMDAMSWMCIAGGANGLIYYSYFDILRRDKATDVLPAISFDEHFGECKQIAERIMAHEKVLLSTGTPLAYTIVANDKDEVIFRPYGLDGVTWLLAVNTSSDAPRSFKLDMERPVQLQGVSLSTPAVTVDGKSVSATLQPLESVFIQLK